MTNPVMKGTLVLVSFSLHKSLHDCALTYSVPGKFFESHYFQKALCLATENLRNALGMKDVL